MKFPKGGPNDLPSKDTIAININKDMLAGKKILVVDDNKMNRLVAKTILHNYGAITTEAVNGKEAIELLQQFEIDLVLMDIQMPVMGGMEATRIIREELGMSLPVIALTANAIKGDNEKCTQGGMNAYLSKPFKEDDLLKIVSFWLENKEAPNGQNSNGKLYDLAGIKAISRGNEHFVLKMVNMFITNTPAQVAEMEMRYHQKDFKGMGSIAHKIKPGIDNMGISALKEIIREIEKTGKSGKDTDSLGGLVQAVSTHLAIVIAALQTELEAIAPVRIN